MDTSIRIVLAHNSREDRFTRSHGARQIPPGKITAMKAKVLEIGALERMGLNFSNLTAVEADRRLG